MFRRILWGLAPVVLLPLLSLSCGGNASSLTPRGNGFGTGFSSPRRFNRPRPGATSTRPVSSHIAFISNEDGHPDVWVMDSDGSNRRNLTGDEASERLPRWAAGGRVLVFVRTVTKEKTTKDELVSYRLDDGRRQVLASAADGVIAEIATSPTTDRVAFVQQSDDQVRIQVTNLDGDKPRTLQETSPPAQVQSVSWLRDGVTLAVIVVPGTREAMTESESAAKKPPAPGIRLVEADTGKSHPLTTDPEDRWVRCSPTTDALAFLRGPALYVIRSTRAKTPVPRRVAERAVPLPPRWSPQGRALAYWVKTDPPIVAVSALDDGEPLLLNLSAETDPAAGLNWSPDGRELAFLKLQTAGTAQRHLLYAIPVRGGSEHRVTQALVDHLEVVWAS